MKHSKTDRSAHADGKEPLPNDDTLINDGDFADETGAGGPTDAPPEEPELDAWGYGIHPAAMLIPGMTEEEYEGLKADIAANDQREPISTLGNLILDGRHRYKACRELGRTPRMTPADKNVSPVKFVVSMNLHRRHLSASQRAMLAAKILPMLEEEAHQRQVSGLKKGDGQPGPPVPINLSERGESREAAAQVFGVGASYVSDAKKVLEASPETAEAVLRGELPVYKAVEHVEQQQARQPLPALEDARKRRYGDAPGTEGEKQTFRQDPDFKKGHRSAFWYIKDEAWDDRMLTFTIVRPAIERLGLKKREVKGVGIPASRLEALGFRLPGDDTPNDPFEEMPPPKPQQLELPTDDEE